eukprot:TRINITY_DN882_c0_g1_i1.p1 TRINITY_DN882_c0_g1~~TRINITY_DN882_c0_g1_i1.p1  ORF type:complete len:394 (-),score=91.40 TRINITY_DN882_c0_g1_i1:112-1293(-)
MSASRIKEKNYVESIIKAAPVDLNDPEGVLAERIDQLSEKRYALREAALKAINQCLSLRVCSNFISDRQETLAEALVKILSKGGDEEQQLAMQTISLACMNLTFNRHMLFSKMIPPLINIIRDESKKVEEKTRVSALDCMSVVQLMSSVFGESNEVEVVNEVAQIFQEIIKDRRTSPDILTAALNAWMITGTVNQGTIEHDGVYIGDMKRLVQLLGDSQPLCVRIAAAKFVGVLIENIRSDESESESDHKEDWNEVIDELNQLVADKGKYKSQADRKKQKEFLRMILAYIETEQEPISTMMIRNYQLQLDTLAHIMQLELFKTVLADGFMTHMEANTNMMYFFDYYISDVADLKPFMSKRERRLSWTDTNKINSKRRSSLRDERSEQIGYASM